MTIDTMNVIFVLQYSLLFVSTVNGFSGLSTFQQQSQKQFFHCGKLQQGNTIFKHKSNKHSYLNVLTLPDIQQQQRTVENVLIATSVVDSTIPEMQQQQTTTTTTVRKSWNDDGFVFGLQGSGLERPRGKTSLIVVEGDSLETKPYQQITVGMTFVSHACFLLLSFTGLLQIHNGNVITTLVHSILLLVSSWILADFGSGVLHWSVDNYGNGKTPIMGSIIAAFQGHHTAPWTITQRGFCNNVYKLCIPFGIIPVSLLSLLFLQSSPGFTMFITFFCIFEILSQEFHRWSHQLISETPTIGTTLQQLQLSVGRKQHAQHHIAPFDGNYCIISGVCNTILDTIGFFRRLEHIVYKINGIESNAWKLDSNLRSRTLAGDYSIPK